MKIPSTVSPLNPAQQQHLAALAASVSDSVRTVVILCVLAANRLGLQDGAPKQLAALSCKQIHQWVNRSPHECSYEATRKLLKNLAAAGFAEFCHGRYILADTVAASLAKLADVPNSPSGATATSEAAPGASFVTVGSGNLPAGTPANSEVIGAAYRPGFGAEMADDATNQKAVEYFVQLASNLRGFKRASLYWQIACCRATSIAHLGAAASGLAIAIMSGATVASLPGELQAILDGKSTITPASTATFVFAFEAYSRESAAEFQARADAAKAKAMEPYAFQVYEALLKCLTPQPATTVAPEPTANTNGAPTSTHEEQYPLAPVFQLPLPSDFGTAA